MPQNKGLIVIGFAVFALFLVSQTCFYVVRETENAIVVLFGNPQPVRPGAGLKFKLPWANVIKLDKRNLEYDLDRAMEITDVNQERLTVDAFARYRIVEPLKYYQSFKSGAGDSNGLRRNGQAGIERIMQNTLRQTLGEVSISDIVTNLRAELMERMATRMEDEARKFGVEIIDVKIRRADYPADIAQTVYDQMSSARKEEAELIRAEGQRENTRIQAEANRRRSEILAEANRRSLEITGQADATKNCIFAGAYDGLPVVVEMAERIADSDDADAPLSTGVTCRFAENGPARDAQRAEFFAFYRSLLAYEEALKKGETTILLSPDSEFFRYFNNLQGKR
ncbi:MAG: protease modulator HflC [Parvularculaceae bacterium]